jgi:small subunit ribosomal protein S17
VSIQRTSRHRLYRKVIRRSKKYHVHDESNEATLGDLVRIEESRPYSRLKRWRLVEILTEREVAERRPGELDEEFVDEMQRSAARAASEAEEAEETAEAVPTEVTASEPVAEVDPRRTETDPEAETPDALVEQVGNPDAEPVAEADAADGEEEKAP